MRKNALAYSVRSDATNSGIIGTVWSIQERKEEQTIVYQEAREVTNMSAVYDPHLASDAWELLDSGYELALSLSDNSRPIGVKVDTVLKHGLQFDNTALTCAICCLSPESSSWIPKYNLHCG